MFLAAEVDLRTRFEIDATRAIDLKGRIDRIDERKSEIEVLDYKTRRRQQLTEDLAIAGENVQLPFYGLLYPGGATRASFVYLQRTSDRQDQVGTQPTRQPFPQLVEALRIRLRRVSLTLSARERRSLEILCAASFILGSIRMSPGGLFGMERTIISRVAS